MSIKSEAEQIILRRKYFAEDTADRNLKNVLQDDAIRDLFNKCKGLIVDIAKLDVDGKDTTIKKKQYYKFRELILKSLLEIGVDKSTLKPNYFCKKCNDTGYLNGKPCECLKKEISLLQMKQSSLNFSDMPKFNNDFSVFEDKAFAKTLYSKMKKLVEECENSKFKCVLISGDTGCGKTYLLECMTSYSIELGKNIKFATAFNFNMDMLKYHLASLEEKNQIMDTYLNCDILFIDDLGSENRINNVTNEYLYLILNERMTAGKLTVISTNLKLDAIQDVYGERIFSRLMHKDKSLKIHFKGSDLRIKK